METYVFLLINDYEYMILTLYFQIRRKLKSYFYMITLKKTQKKLCRGLPG